MAAGGLVDRLARGRLDTVPTEVPPVRGLSGDHARAFHACTTPGLRAIWGPPGTGKTTVLSQAVDELLSQGSRVLLVSGTNVAVDNVLTRVVGPRDPAPGEIVRVGTPHLAEIQRTTPRTSRREHESTLPHWSVHGLRRWTTRWLW